MKWFARSPAQHAVTVLSLESGVAALRLEPGGPAGLPRVTRAGQGSEAGPSLKAWVRAGWFKHACVVLVLPTRLRSTHLLPRPDVPDAELVEAARWQLAATLDYPAEEALLDVLPLPVLAGSQPPQVLALCARRAAVQAHLAPLLAAGVQPAVIDVADLAQRNLALLASRHAPANACIGPDHGQVLLTLSAGGELCVTRSLMLGEAGGENDDREDIDIGTGPGAAAAQRTERLALQLQRTLDTFERQATNFAVRRLWVLPRTRDRQFADLLASHVALPVEPVRLEGLFDLSAVQPGWDSAPFERYVHLLGAAVGRLDGVLDASLPATEAVAA
jgi:MSHA biogenesis protein MshI